MVSILKALLLSSVSPMKAPTGLPLAMLRTTVLLPEVIFS